MSYYPYQGHYVVQSSNTSSDVSWSDLKSDLKKAGNSFLEWLSKLTKGNSRCANCHKNGATTIRFSKEVAFCSHKCHQEALQNYQKHLGVFTMLS